jgi:hypothetical protein
MDKLKYLLIKDIINNTVFEQTKKIDSTYYNEFVMKETFEKNLETDLQLLSESSLFLIHKTILQKKGK